MKCRYCREKIAFFRSVFAGGICKACAEYDEWLDSEPKITITERDPKNDSEAFISSEPRTKDYLVKDVPDFLEMNQYEDEDNTFFTFYLNNG